MTVLACGLLAAIVAAAEPPVPGGGAVVASPASVSGTAPATAAAPPASSTLSAAAPGATVPAGSAPVVAAPSSTAYLVVPQAAAPSSTILASRAAVAPAVSASVHEFNLAFDELHKRASIVMLPSAFAAHVKRPTGENVEIFFSWYIGTFWAQSVQRDGKLVSGADIRALFSMFIGADAKWAFLQEHGGRPAAAFGYYGGFVMPFAGGPVRASEIAKRKQAQAAGEPPPPSLTQTFVHDVYLALSKNVGPVSLTLGGMYGIKQALPLLFPTLRNPGTSSVSNLASQTPWLAFGGADWTLRSQHLKIEFATLPLPVSSLGIAGRPWLVQTHIDSFLGFDLAYVKDPVGYEVIGYYLLPFVRWPDRKRLEKETERLRAAKTGAITAP